MNYIVLYGFGLGMRSIENRASEFGFEIFHEVYVSDLALVEVGFRKEGIKA